jgi:hypothetical protein
MHSGRLRDLEKLGLMPCLARVRPLFWLLQFLQLFYGVLILGIQLQ